MVTTSRVNYLIERYNGNHWEGGYGDFSSVAKAIERFEIWKVEQPNSPWRVLVHTEIETPVFQYEPS